MSFQSLFFINDAFNKWQYEKQRYDLFFNAESGTLKLRRLQKIFFKTLLNVVLIVRYKLKIHSSSSINTTFK